MNLQYAKGPYGPNATKLRHVLTLLEGHYITGYGDANDTPNRQFNLRPEMLPQTEAFLEQHPATQKHFQKVVDLISGFDIHGPMHRA